MRWFASLWMLAFWVLGIGLPLGAIIQEGVQDLTWQNLFDPVVLGVVWATLRQVFWSTFFSGTIGLGLGLLIGRSSQEGAGTRALALFSVPMVIPSVVAGLGWLIWLGKFGILSKLGIHLDLAYRFEAVILAHSFYNIPWVALVVAHARQLVPGNQLEALKTLGASRWSLFAHGIWPHLRWTWAAACAQVMGFCAVSFALVLTLGGGPPVQTLETEVYSRLKFGGVDWAGALACAIWELCLTLIPWLLVLFFQDREKFKVTQSFRAAPGESSGILVRMKSFLPFSLGIFFLLPYFGVYTGSWSSIPKFFQTSEVIRALKFSFSLAVWSSTLTVLTTFIVLSVLFRPKLNPKLRSILGLIFALPSGVSVIVLGLGVWLAYGRWIDPFSGSPGAMILLQVTLFFPLAMRALWNVAASTDVVPMNVAQTLGASPVQAWIEVEWPRWRGPVLVAAGTVFGAVLGEVGAVSLFASEKWVTLPSLISQSMQRYQFEEAQMLAALLLTVSVFSTLGATILGECLTHKKVTESAV